MEREREKEKERKERTEQLCNVADHQVCQHQVVKTEDISQSSTDDQ